tara:strand:- start:460 stop:1122 length:663 start_codon:yes stop_codon:yes gene_type:complete
MKTKSKIAIAASASLAIGALTFALPSLAHDSQGPNSSERKIESGMHGDRPNASEMRKEHNSATLSATITGIPAEITELREVVKGANYEIFRLEAGVTAAPTTKPTTGGHVIGVRPVLDTNLDLIMPDIAAGTVTGNLVFKASPIEGVEVFALYPSDESAPILVTVTTNAAGDATASATEALSLNYDADDAASFEPRGNKLGKGEHKGMRNHGQQHENFAD